MTLSKAYYEQSVCYHLPTMELKRNSILGYLECLKESEHERGVHSMSYHGYYRTELLEAEIAFTMGWVHEGEVNDEKRIVPNLDDTRLALTLRNMEAKGHIRLSKSGRGFKILDTWRRRET